jgi:predicted nucleic acid-binding protein
MIAADTSVLVPAIVADHEFHDACHESAGLVDAAIAQTLVELYAVLTRLPQPFTVPPAAAGEAVRSYSHNVVGLTADETSDLIDSFVRARVTGGSTYDALIAAAASRHDVTLLTRDERAASTYERLGADVRWVAT